MGFAARTIKKSTEGLLGKTCHGNIGICCERSRLDGNGIDPESSSPLGPTSFNALRLLASSDSAPVSLISERSSRLGSKLSALVSVVMLGPARSSNLSGSARNSKPADWRRPLLMTILPMALQSHAGENGSMGNGMVLLHSNEETAQQIRRILCSLGSLGFPITPPCANQTAQRCFEELPSPLDGALDPPSRQLQSGFGLPLKRNAVERVGINRIRLSRKSLSQGHGQG